MKEDNKNNTNTKQENINDGFSEYLKEQNIKAFYEFDKFEFMAPDKDGLGLGETNVIVVEKEIEGEDGKKIPVFEFYKDGELLANTNERGELILSEGYKEQLKSQSKEYYNRLNLEKRELQTISKEDIEKRLEQEEKSPDEKKKEDAKEQKQEENKKEEGEVTKEAIEEKFGDKYVVASKIIDEEIADKLIATEGFVGYPLMAYNKETKEFVLIGTMQNGELKEAEMLRTESILNVNEYNYDGSIVRETTITGMTFLPPENNDAISMELNEYGEIEINKIVNARGDNPQSFPIDTEQTMPTTKEIEEMKENGDGMEEIMEIIEDMKEEEIIDDIEETEILEEISTNGKTLDEDKEMLEKVKKEKEQDNEENEEEEEKTQEEIDEELWWVPNRDR